MKCIKRRSEGQDNNDAIFIWQNQKECFRLFINFSSFQLNINYGRTGYSRGYNFRFRKIPKNFPNEILVRHHGKD